MNINLKNIGIISDSSVDIDGLTVITGKNNSGKTTVGKAIYSLIDAVSNLQGKYQNDKENYIFDRLVDLMEHLDVFYLIFSSCLDDEPIKGKYPLIDQCISFGNIRRDNKEAEVYAKELRDEISKFSLRDVTDLSDFRVLSKFYSEKRNTSIEDRLIEQKEEGISYIDQIFKDISRDSNLKNYSRQSIFQTLWTEFSGQIQPVKSGECESQIVLSDADTTCFNLRLSQNKIIDDDNPIYYSSPVKRVLFIDDPYVLEDLPSSTLRRRRKNSFFDNDSEETYIVNKNRIIPHRDRTIRILKNPGSGSILEQVVINEKYKEIKKKIDAIIPGTFEFSASGDYYVTGDAKLKVSNMAMGSKMFSIIKILFDKGLLDEKTLLILDEPEAHLHPQWQNEFAEIIVLLIKELGIKVLLTSHSSNFVLAMDAYARKHEINDKSHFYQTVVLNGDMVGYQCVDQDLGLIYQSFLDAFSEVKAIRDRYLEGE